MKGELTPAVVHHDFRCGVWGYIYPISPYTLQALDARVEAAYPMFDTAPYIVTVDEDVMVVKTSFLVTDLPSENPHHIALAKDYQRRLNALTAERNAMRTRLIFETVLDFPDKDRLLKLFADRIARIRETTETDEDDWHIVLFHIILSTNDEQQRVLNIALDRVPLTEGEVVNGLKIFRVRVSGDGLPDAARQPSGIPATEAG